MHFLLRQVDYILRVVQLGVGVGRVLQLLLNPPLLYVASCVFLVQLCNYTYRLHMLVQTHFTRTTSGFVVQFCDQVSVYKPCV